MRVRRALGNWLDGLVAADDMADSSAMAHREPARPDDYVPLRVVPQADDGSKIIEYSLPTAGAMALKICSVSGGVIDILALGKVPAGEHRIAWKVKELPSGVYFCTLESKGLYVAQKVLLYKPH